MANNTNLSFPSAFCQQFFKDGKPLSSGKLYTYIAGSSTAVVTYKTISGGTESANMNTNPIILDMSGKANLVISKDTAYKFVLFDRNDVKVDEWDNVTAGGSEGGGGSNVYVEGTDGEIDVEEESAGHIRRFIVSLSDSVKNAISNLSSSVNDIIDALYNKKDKQQPVSASGSTTKVPVSFVQDANGELDIEFDDIAFPDWTTAINNAVANCEQTSNKKNSVTGYESSTTAYPSIKAVVDFVNSIMQNLGGKLITDNGNPFSDSNDLPSTTPYQGVTISDKDYAYVQGTGFAERWSASVSGSDVTWVQEYSINIPVFTPSQQDAIDSGATATKIGNYDSHIANTTIHVTSTEKNTWNAKQNALPTTGTPSSTFAINVSGNAASTDIANVANTLPYGRAAWNGSAQKGDKKVVCINPTELNYSDVMVTLDIYETVAAVGDMFRGKLMIDLRRNLDPTYAYNASYVGMPFRYTTMYVKYDPNSHSVYVIFNKNNDNYVGIKAVVASAQGYQGTSAMSNVTLYNNPDIETTTQYTNISITYNYICMVQSQVGSTRLPIYVDEYGIPRPCSNIPTPQTESWSGEASVTATGVSNSGMIRFYASLDLNHGWGDGTHGFINYEVNCTSPSRKGESVCEVSVVPGYSGGAQGIRFLGYPFKFVENPPSYTNGTGVHVCGVGNCWTGSLRTIPSRLIVQVDTDASKFSVGDTLGISVHVTATKLL